MAAASYVVPSFLGGEISKFAQGRFDKPDYRISMKACRNAFPVEIGAWVRRPGARFAGTTRTGLPGRVIRFDFEQSSPYTLELTDGVMRFRSGANLATTNDPVTILSISTASPAVVELQAAPNWPTGTPVIFPSPAPSPILENRQFFLTQVDPTHYSLSDGVQLGVPINGATLGTISGGIIARVQELLTSYAGGAWANVRVVQAETTGILLAGPVAPQALNVTTLPGLGRDAIFEIGPALFLDGPYLDPVNGSTITPDATTGLINMTLGFQAYSAAQAYSKGDFAQNSGIGYKSLQDGNSGHTPASSPTFWQRVSFGAAVNDGRGFLSTDIGRQIRIYNPNSAPAWNSATIYAAGDLVTQSNVGYQSLIGANLNNMPSVASAFWKPLTPGWTWGRIVSLSSTGLVNPALGAIYAASFTNPSRAFDGATSKVFSACSVYDTQNPLGNGGAGFMSASIGKDLTSSPQSVSSVAVYPSTDRGYGLGYNFIDSGGNLFPGVMSSFSITLYGSNVGAGVSGTVLGSVAMSSSTTTPVTILSNDSATAWNFIWVTYQGFVYLVSKPGLSAGGALFCAQLQIFNNTGVAGEIVKAQLIGPPLPSTATSTVWRLGAYSDTTGYPTCGCYHEGRIWLGGAIPNRFDASVSNGIDGAVLNFAPTDTNGAVAASNAISYTLNSDSVNNLLWMTPDLQGIIMGTQGNEWLVQAPTNGPIAPANIAARRVTKIGSDNVEPRRTEHTNVFVKRFGRKLMEYFADVYSGKFTAPNIADKAQHISRAGISELAYTEAVTPIIWGRCADGTWFGITYKRDTLTTAQGPTYAAWAPHQLGSGRVVESISSGPSVGGDLDALTMVTNDPTTNIRHVEILTDTMDEDSELTEAWYLDNSVSPTSTTLTNVPSGNAAPYGGLTVNGLWHLNGKTVQVFAGGLDCGDRGYNTTVPTDFLVTNGSTFIPFGDGVSAGSGRGLFTADYVASFVTGIPIVVGFTYTSRGQLVRMINQADTGARNGPGFGKLSREHRYAVQLVNTKGISFGSDFSKTYPAKLSQPNGQPIATLDMFTGIHTDTLDDDTSYDRALCWEITRPFPANVVAVGGNLTTQDQ